MFRIWRKLKDQSMYQGKSKMRNYFEGWYFKIVDSSENTIYAIIPGVSYNSKSKNEAFIQVFDGKEGEMKYIPYPITDFSFDSNEFHIRIGDSTFSQKSMTLNINTDEIKVNGTIEFSDLLPWSASLFSGFSCMGWYRYVPRMECYHGITSFDHQLQGSLSINGKTIDFTGGKGYIEKDYGRSFPKYYLWCQSNHFDLPRTSVMVSFAKIPWFFSYFDGFLAGLMVKGTLYRFATYTGAKVAKLEISDRFITIHLQDKTNRLEVIASRNDAVLLPSPIDGAMTGRILESITAELDIRLIDIKTGETIFAGVGRNAGLDIGGDIEEIPRI